MDAASINAVAILLATTIILWAAGEDRLARVGLALFGNWAAQTAYVVWSGDYYPWLWFLIIDAATAWYVLRPPSTFTQVFIGAIGLAQVLSHGAYAVNPLIADMYLNALDWLGRAQLAVLIAGGGYGLAWRGYCTFSRSGRGRMAGAHGATRMDWVA